MRAALAMAFSLAFGQACAGPLGGGVAWSRAAGILAWDRDRTACASGTSRACAAMGSRERDLAARGLCRVPGRDPKRSWAACGAGPDVP